MSINIIQWEKNYQLTQEELLIIKNQYEDESEEFQDQNIQKQPYLVDIKECKQNEDFLQLQELQLNYQQKFSKLSVISKNLQQICAQLNQLNNDKQQIIENISTFHQEASQHINEQKQLIDYSFQIQENLEYYNKIQKIQKQLDTQDQQDLNFQVIMSEISDGIIFFQSRPTFYKSDNCVLAYKSLKKTLLSVCKTSIFKLLSKEASFTNEKISVVRDVLYVFYPPSFQQSNYNWHPVKLQILSIIFPQFIPFFNDQNQGKKFIQLYQEDLNKFEISEQMHDFFHYLEQQIGRDSDLFTIFNDVFLQYNNYNRLNLHEKLNQLLIKQTANLNQAGNILAKIHKDLNQLMDVQEVAKCNEVLILESLINMIFEITIIEFQYTLLFFRSENHIIQENQKNLIRNICDRYSNTVKIYLSKISTLENFVGINDALKQLEEAISSLQLSQVKYKNLYYINEIFLALSNQKIHSQQPQQQLSFNQTITKNIEIYSEIIQINFINKIKTEIAQRSIASSQMQIQQKISTYSTKEYIKNKGRLIIHKYLDESQPRYKGYEIQRGEFYPPVLVGLDLIKKMQKSIDHNIFKQLAGEVLREINNQLKDIAEHHEVKFDSYLFYLKNIIHLCDELSNLGGDYVVKESELDFSETKAILLKLITGQIRPEIQWIELTSPEKLWTYITNFFQFMYKGLPKVNSYEIDWKENLMNQKNLMLFQFVKDMTFIVAKQLIQFIRYYQYLQHKLEENSTDKEQAQLDFQQQISFESIKRTYQLFYENIMDFLQEIVLKLNNYLNKQIFEQIEVLNYYKQKLYLNEIIQNSLSLLSQFFIIVSTHYGSEEYENFKFVSTDELLKTIKIIYND